MQKKRLIVCFDGTWNAADSARAETNVARIARAVRANSGADGVPQLCLYLRGVGTSGSALDRLVAGATGEGIEDTIRAAYMFLAQNYAPARPEQNEPEADEIFLFGFSRGAFAARSLTGWLGAAGLLKRQSLGRITDAWAFYRRRSVSRRPEVFVDRHPGIETHADVKVRFLGVWDTVGALGIPVGVFSGISKEIHGFHDTTPSRIVRHGAHALAIDEHRDAFVPTLWTGAAPQDSLIEQVWFAGAHADVGGGYADRALADMPLAWMAGRAAAAGLQLDPDMLPKGALKPGPVVGAPDPAAAMHNSKTGWEGLDPTPTYRCVCERSFAVPPFVRLYRPLGASGRPVTTLNESLHPSVVARWGRNVEVVRHDEKGRSANGVYRPDNLAPAMTAGGAAAEGVQVWTTPQ